MKNIQRIMVACLMFAGMFTHQADAKVRAVMSQREFEQNVTHKGICVALFYNMTDKRNARLRQDNKQLQRRFDEVSAKESYDAADVVFIKINTARTEFDAIIKQYGVTQVPCFMLFSDGRLLKERGKPCMLNGFAAREILEAFIDKYCGKDIKILDMAKDATQAQRIQAERAPWLPYFYPRDIFVRDYDPAQRDME